MINYKKTYKESTSWRHWRLSCFLFFWVWQEFFFQKKLVRQVIKLEWPYHKTIVLSDNYSCVILIHVVAFLFLACTNLTNLVTHIGCMGKQ